MITLTPNFCLKLFVIVEVIVVLLSCVINFVLSPFVLCLLDGNCKEVSYTSVQGMYPRTVATACFLSFATLLCKYGSTMAVYDRNVEAHEMYSATTIAERRNRALFSCSFVVLCLSVILPVNMSRFSILYANHSETVVLVFFVLMYLENVTMCMTEAHFVTLCYALDKKFDKINRDLEHLGEEIADPTTTASPRNVPAIAAVDSRRAVIYVNDFYGSGEQSLANAVEVIRIRHRLIRDAVYALIDLFGIPMGMSLFNLCVMTLFDIYYQVSNVMGADSRPSVFIYMWMVQYTIRFYTVVVTAHNTTKQALKSKILITDINNRYLDNQTKEELQLFLNQISSCSIEFTAADFFTLNTHLITSAIAAGTTYLVILLQFNSSK